MTISTYEMDALEASSFFTFKSPNNNTGKFASAAFTVKTVLDSISILSALLPTLILNLVDDPFNLIGNMVSILLLTCVCNLLIAFTHNKFAFWLMVDVKVIVSTFCDSPLARAMDVIVIVNSCIAFTPKKDNADVPILFAPKSLLMINVFTVLYDDVEILN